MRVANLNAGSGRDHLCAVCAERISTSQIEYEVNVVRDLKLRFHIKCFAVWQLECARQTETQGGVPPDATSTADSGGISGNGKGRQGAAGAVRPRARVALAVRPTRGERATLG